MPSMYFLCFVLTSSDFLCFLLISHWGLLRRPGRVYYCDPWEGFYYRDPKLLGGGTLGPGRAPFIIAFNFLVLAVGGFIKPTPLLMRPLVKIAEPKNSLEISPHAICF